MFCIALSSDVVMRAVCLHFVIICGESLIMRRGGGGGGTSPQRKWSEQEVTVGNKERDGGMRSRNLERMGKKQMSCDLLACLTMPPRAKHQVYARALILP